MCDQRERLLSYVYDEGDAAERAEVQRHLDQCPDCRAEIAGLRSVRNDLLAWEVPAHEPVWRPFVAAPPVPWFRQVPAWALAAAAGVVLLLGATGSVIAQSMMPERVVARETPTNVVATPVVSPELRAAEAKLTALEQQLSEMGARVNRAAYRTQAAPAIEGNHDAIAQELARLRAEFSEQLKTIYLMQQSLDELKASSKASHLAYDTKINNLSRVVDSQGK